MKKLQNIFLILLAVLAWIPSVVSADDEPYKKEWTINGDKYIESPKNLFLSKTVAPSSVPGEYTISLKAFAAGSSITTTTETHKPADIVLVLDVSGSMDDGLSGSYTKYNARSSQSYSYTDCRNKQYYYKYYNTATDEYEYYLVYRGRDGGLAVYPRQTYLYFTTDAGVTYYLTTSGLSTTKVTYSAYYTTIWTGVLYEKESGTRTKMIALQEAVEQFITVVQQDASENNVNHRISIVKYADDSYKPNSESSLEEGDDLNDDDYNYTQVVKNLTVVNATGAQNLIDAVERLQATGATAADYGMRKAQYVLASTNPKMQDVAGQDRSKVVVMFTDGDPNHGSGFSTSVAGTTIGYAKTLKDDGVVVYTVGIFKNANDNEKKYLEYVSSDYPNANNWTYTAPYAYPFEKCYITEGADLSDIFTGIAQETTTGGAGTTIDVTTTATIDVLSACFQLPDGVNSGNTSRIKVYTANFDGNHDSEENYYHFDYSATSKVPYGGAQVTIDDATKKITVKGFDYSANWCGYNQSGSTYTAKGKQLIIEIPIVVDPANPGGASLLTNTSESGLYDEDGEVITPFDMPILTIPNIIIRKAGLQKEGESATFKITRLNSANPDDVDNTTPPFSIVLTNKVASNGRPYDFVVAKIKLQSVGYYKVEETTWSWGYTPVVKPDNAFRKVAQPTETMTTTDPYTITHNYTNKEGNAATTVSKYSNSGRWIVREVNVETQVFLEEDFSGEKTYTAEQIAGMKPEDWIFENKGTVFNFSNTPSSGSIQTDYHEDAILNKFKTINTLDHEQ